MWCAPLIAFLFFQQFICDDDDDFDDDYDDDYNDLDDDNDLDYDDDFDDDDFDDDKDKDWMWCTFPLIGFPFPLLWALWQYPLSESPSSS